MSNKKGSNNSMRYYAWGYVIATVFLPIIPTFLSIVFRIIVGYALTLNDLMFDTILIVAGIISSSIWSTYWSSNHISSALRFVIMIIQMCVMTVGYALYLGLFGFQLPDASGNSLTKSTVIIILISCVAILLLNTLWDVQRETKQSDLSNQQRP